MCLTLLLLLLLLLLLPLPLSPHLHDVEEPRHQGEEEHARPLGFQAREELVQEAELAAVGDDVVPHGVQGAVLDPVEQVGVVDRLPQLHGDVRQAAARLLPLPPLAGHPSRHVALKYLLVPVRFSGFGSVLVP